MKVLVVFVCFVISAACGTQLLKDPAPDVVCPQDDPNGTFMHEEYCDKYYECVDGEAVLVTCPDGLLFDPKRALHGRTKCDEPFNNDDCGNRTLLQDPKPSDDGVCPRQNGRFEHQDPAVCDQYVDCRHGTWNLLSCAPGLHYSPDLGQCTWPNQAKRTGCGRKKITLADGFSCPDVQNTLSVHNGGTQDPNPTYPHSTSCTSFYVCIRGIEPRLNVCDAGLVYNIDKKICDNAENVPECAPGEEEPAQ